MRKKNTSGLMAPRGDKGPAAEGSPEEEMSESEMEAIMEGDESGATEDPREPMGAGDDYSGGGTGEGPPETDESTPTDVPEERGKPLFASRHGRLTKR